MNQMTHHTTPHAMKDRRTIGHEKTTRHYIDHYSGLSDEQLREARKRIKRYRIGAQGHRDRRIAAIEHLLQE